MASDEFRRHRHRVPRRPVTLAGNADSIPVEAPRIGRIGLERGLSRCLIGEIGADLTRRPGTVLPGSTRETGVRAHETALTPGPRPNPLSRKQQSRQDAGTFRAF